MLDAVGVYQGSVVFFNVIRGFGFLKCDALGKDIFFHATGVIQDGSPPLRSGEQVAFTVANEEGRDRAVNVSRIRMVEPKGADHNGSKQK
jgi:CspA family cold shock protein